MEKFGSGLSIPDPQHCIQIWFWQFWIERKMNNVSPAGHREDPAEYKYEDDEDSNDEDNVRDVILH